MNYLLINRQPRLLLPREALPHAELQVLWRLESGALRMDSDAPDESSDFVRLALPGDLLGVESLVGVTERLVVRALTPARLVPVVWHKEKQLTQLLMAAVLKGHQRCREVVSLRTGSATVRIQRLLQMLVHKEASDASEAAVCALPSLSDMAAIVNAAPETVCRVLGSLRQLNFLQDCSPRGVRHNRLDLREHRLQPGTCAHLPTA
jgi:CRP-like cAMP-binding protein